MSEVARVFNLFNEVIFEGTEQAAYEWMKEAVSKRGNRDWDNSKCTVKVADNNKLTAREFLDKKDEENEVHRVLDQMDQITFEGTEDETFDWLITVKPEKWVRSLKVETVHRGVMSAGHFVALKRKQKEVADRIKRYQDEALEAQTVTIKNTNAPSLLDVVEIRRAAMSFTTLLHALEKSIEGDLTANDQGRLKWIINDFQTGLDSFSERFFGEEMADETEEAIREVVREEISKAFSEFDTAVIEELDEIENQDGKAAKRTSHILSTLMYAVARFRKNYTKNLGTETE